MKIKKIIMPLAIFTMAVGVTATVAFHNEMAEAKAAVKSGWTRVAAVSEITSGGTFIIGYEATANSDVIIPLRSDGAAASTTTNGLLYSGATAGSATNGTIDMSSIADTSFYELTLAASSTTTGAVNIQMISGNYIGNPGAKNTAKLYAAPSLNTDYTPTLESGVFKFTSPTSVSTTYTTLQYNVSAPRFANYGGTQKNLTLYKQSVSTDIVSALSVNPTSKSYSTNSTLMAADFTVNITKNGVAGSSDDYTAQIGTGFGASFSGSDIVWGTTKPTSANTAIQFKAKYPTVAGGATYLTADVSLTVSVPSIIGINISGSLSKAAYNVTESWSPAGLIVTALFDDDEEVFVTNEVVWSYNPSAPNNTSITSVTITATYSGAVDSDSYSVTVSPAPEISGIYTLASSATEYKAVASVAEATERTSGLGAGLVITDQTNMRYFGSPVTSDIMFGSSSGGASISLATTNSNYIVSKVVVKAESYSSATIASIECAGMTQQVANYYTSATPANYVDFTFYPLASSFTLSTIISGSSYRIFANTITVTIVPLADGANAYGELFTSTTASECAALSGISAAHWTLLSTVYANANAAVKSSIVGASANVSGTAIEQALARYDYVVNKYTYTDFLSRRSSSAGFSKNSSSNNLMIIILSATSLVSIAAIVFYIRKKKISK